MINLKSLMALSITFSEKGKNPYLVMQHSTTTFDLTVVIVSPDLKDKERKAFWNIFSSSYIHLPNYTNKNLLFEKRQPLWPFQYYVTY